MSQLTYNGVSITNLSTKDVSYEDILTDDMQDYLCTKVTVNVTGYVFAGVQQQDSQNTAPVGAGPGANFVTIQHKLEQYRQTLFFQTDAVIINADANTDVKNGPFPKVLSITRIDGYGAILISFRVETYRHECSEVQGFRKPAYISNRWRDEESRDLTFLAKRTRTGKLIILGGAGQVAIDALRPVVVPAIPSPNFVRRRMVFVIQEDGLAMSYTVEDEEVIENPPAPAVDADGSYVEVMPYPGAVRWGTATVSLRGSKATPTDTLVTLGMTLVLARLKAAGAQPLSQSSSVQGLTQGFAFETHVSHDYKTNTVKISARSRMKPYANNNTTATTAIANFSHFKTLPWSTLQATNSGAPINTSKPPPFQISSEGLQLESAPSNNLPCGYSNGGAGGNAGGGNQTGAGSGSGSSSVLGSQSGAGAAAAGNPSVQYPNNATAAVAANVMVQNGGTEFDNGEQGDWEETYYAPYAPDVPDDSEMTVPGGGPYTYYRVEPRFSVDSGIVEMPGTDETQDVAFVQVKQPTTRLVLIWAAEREGQPPEIPTAILTGDCGPVQLKSELMPGMMEALPGGTYKYVIAGQFTYGFKQPSKVQYNAAISPWSIDLQTAEGDPTFGLSLESAAGEAVSNVSDRIFNVGPLTPSSPGEQSDPFNDDGTGDTEELGSGTESPGGQVDNN